MDIRSNVEVNKREFCLRALEQTQLIVELFTNNIEEYKLKYTDLI